jgi:integrase
MSEPKEKRKRRTGQGGLTKYQTKQGIRWRWRIYVEVDGKPKRISKAGYLHDHDAQKDMQKALDAARENQPVALHGKTTIADQASAWLLALDRDTLAPSTIQGYEKIVRNHVIPQLGKMRVDRLTVTDVNAHYQQLRDNGNRKQSTSGQPLSANTVNKVHIVLGSIMESAVDDGLIARNPVRHKKVRAPKGSAIRKARPEIETWSAEQLSQFLMWSRDAFNDELFPLWRVLAFTGMRRSEALALRWSDWNAKTMQLSVRRAVDVTQRDTVKGTKSDRPRVIDVDAETAEVISKWRLERGKITMSFIQRDALIFGLLRDNRLRSPNELNKRWNHRIQLAQAAIPNLPRLTLKGLRHTHATILLNLGVPGKVIQERLGHATIAITMDIYSHVWSTTQESAVAALSAAIRSS